MKKQPRAITARAWTARWLVVAYVFTLIHTGQLPFTLATEEFSSIPGVSSSPEDTPEDPSSEDSPDTSQESDSSETSSNEEESSSEDGTATEEESSSESETTTEEEASSQDDTSSQDESETPDDSESGEEDESEEGDDVMAVAATTSAITIQFPTGAGFHFGVNIRYYNGDTLVETSPSWLITTVDGTERKLSTGWVGTPELNDEGVEYSKFIGYLATTESTGGTIASESTVVLTDISNLTFSGYDKVEYEFGGYESGSYKTLVFDPFLVTVTADNKGSLATTISPALSSDYTGTRKTEDTFESIGGDYDLFYLLNNYNAVAFGDLESTHVIGPILVMGEANRTKGDGDVFRFADRTKGIPSYIGTIKISQNWTNSTTSPYAGTSLGYAYDLDKDSGFAYPHLYTKLTGLNLFVVGSNYQQEYVVSNGYAFLSPNHYGHLEGIQQTDTFFSGTQLKDAVDQGLSALENGKTVTGGTISEYKTLSSPTTQTTVSMSTDFVKGGNTDPISALIVEHGSHYKIPSGTHPEYIVIDFDTLQYGVSNDNKPTTVIFEENSLKTVGNYTVFPKIYIKDGHSGKDAYLLPTPNNGEGGEFSDLGNKLIWDLSAFNGKDITFAGAGMNIVGHFLAPNANITNYLVTENSGTWAVNENEWNGGNINGMVIANNIYAGTMEFHLWPYMDSAETEAYYATKTILEGTKTADGGTAEGFTFILSDTAPSGYVFSSLGSDFKTSGYEISCSTEVKSEADGSFEFNFIHFSEAGNYLFFIYESKNNRENYISYDDSCYGVVIPVTLNSETKSLEVGTITATKFSASGATQSIYVQESLSTGNAISFHNKYTVVELPETGGGGTVVYTMLGLGLMCLAVVLLQPNRKETLL